MDKNKRQIRLAKKDFLSKKIISELERQNKTQVQLAEYAGIKQGHLSDHIRKKSYPKITILLKYAEFLNLTPYELTNDIELKGLEKVDEDNPPINIKTHIELLKKLSDKEKEEILEYMLFKINKKG